MGVLIIQTYGLSHTHFEQYLAKQDRMRKDEESRCNRLLRASGSAAASLVCTMHAERAQTLRSTMQRNLVRS